MLSGSRITSVEHSAVTTREEVLEMLKVTQNTGVNHIVTGVAFEFDKGGGAESE